jgi:hypothetical protein
VQDRTRQGHSHKHYKSGHIAQVHEPTYEQKTERLKTNAVGPIIPVDQK